MNLISVSSLLLFQLIRVRKKMIWRDIREGAFDPKLPTPGENPVTIRQPTSGRGRIDIPGRITTSPTLNGTWISLRSVQTIPNRTFRYLESAKLYRLPSLYTSSPSSPFSDHWPSACPSLRLSSSFSLETHAKTASVNNPGPVQSITPTAPPIFGSSSTFTLSKSLYA